MTASMVEIFGLGAQQGETVVAVCILRLQRPTGRAGVQHLIRGLESILGASCDEAEEFCRLEEKQQLVVLPWAPPSEAELETQEATLRQVAQREHVEAVWLFQVGTSVLEEEEEEEEYIGEGEWHHGLPPRQDGELPFPVDGFPGIIDEFDWYDFGIAVKLGTPRLPGEGTVLEAFHRLWLIPCAGQFRNTSVTFDRHHRAAHFWVDRFTVPLTTEHTVRNLLWVIAGLNEVIPVIHATFQPATMGDKYAHLVGDTREPLVLAGNPLGMAYRRGGFDAVVQWKRQQSDWSPEEVARMLQSTAIDVAHPPAEDDDLKEQREDGGDTLELARVNTAVRLLRDAVELAPLDDEVQFTYGRMLLSANKAGELIAAMRSFDSGTTLQLTNVLGDSGSPYFVAALEMLLDAPLPERVFGERGGGCVGATISSFGNQSSELLSTLVQHTSIHAAGRLDDLLRCLPDDVSLLCSVAFSLYEPHPIHARALYERLLEFPPPERGTSAARVNYCRALNNACIMVHAANNYDIAVKIADRAQVFGHENPFIYHATACAYAAVGRFDVAFEQIERLVEYDYPHLERVEIDTDLGEILEWDRFSELFDRWRAVRPCFVEGSKALEDGDLDEAITLLRDACGNASPLARKAVINLGLAYGKVKKYELMWKCSLTAHQRFPQDVDILANLISAARELGRLSELVPVVLEAYERLRPEPRAIENVTYVLNECNEHERSVEAIEWWLEHHEYMPTVAMGNVVNAYLQAGRFEDGVRWAREYVNVNNTAVAWWFLCEAMMVSGEIDAALDAAQACLERNVDVFRQLATDPSMEPLTADPRFEHLLSVAGGV